MLLIFDSFLTKHFFTFKWIGFPTWRKYKFLYKKSQKQFCKILILIHHFRYIHKSVLHANDAFPELISWYSIPLSPVIFTFNPCLSNSLYFFFFLKISPQKTVNSWGTKVKHEVLLSQRSIESFIITSRKILESFYCKAYSKRWRSWGMCSSDKHLNS